MYDRFFKKIFIKKQNKIFKKIFILKRCEYDFIAEVNEREVFEAKIF